MKNSESSVECLAPSCLEYRFSASLLGEALDLHPRRLRLGCSARLLSTYQIPGIVRRVFIGTISFDIPQSSEFGSVLFFFFSQ